MMECSQDFSCTECGHEFESAASLLQHFATHVLPRGESGTNDSGISIKSLIHDEYSEEQFENEKSSDSGIDDINPLKLCLVTIDEKQMSKEDINGKVHPENQIEDVELNAMRKYRCCFCQKKFGWPTDLKRHILIHTGERPFKCDLCNSSFTRNFILQKHRRKMHPSETKPKMPALKPIGAVTSYRKISTKFSTP